MKFLKKLFSSILRFIRKVCESLGPFFVILLVVVIVFAPYIAPWLTEMGLTTLGGWVGALGEVMSGVGFWGKIGIGLGAAYLLAPEATGEVVSQIGDLVGDVAGAAGSVITSGVSGLLSSLFSSPIVWVALGVGAYFLFRSDSADSDSDQVVHRSESKDALIYSRNELQTGGFSA